MFTDGGRFTAVGRLVLAFAVASVIWVLLNGAKSDPLQLTGVIAGQLLASSFRPYPAVRIATIFRIVTQ